MPLKKVYTLVEMAAQDLEEARKQYMLVKKRLISTISLAFWVILSAIEQSPCGKQHFMNSSCPFSSLYI
jgi:hypothetical protein